jgi:ribosomal protein S27AE
MQIISASTLTCPRCGHTEYLAMPTDYCQFFYECGGCHEVLKAKEGHCCVFCSYADVPCPSLQERNGLSGNQLTKSVWSTTE